jgi:hypothetical protein
LSRGTNGKRQTHEIATTPNLLTTRGKEQQNLGHRRVSAEQIEEPTRNLPAKERVRNLPALQPEKPSNCTQPQKPDTLPTEEEEKTPRTPKRRRRRRTNPPNPQERPGVGPFSVPALYQ